MKEIFSEYYGKDFSYEELEEAFEFYLDWCDDGGVEPVVDSVDEINEENIDEIVNKAEMKGYEIIL